MGEFGAGISALLETWGKCLSLLKAFKGHSPDDSTTSDAHSQLRKSIRSDKSRVRAAYTARLYRDGKQLSNGDSPSRSKLKRIVNRLEGAILNILNMSKTQQPSIDYASLISLSNSSRIDAIKTMDELSHRLYKPSSSSLSKKRRSPSSSVPSSSSSSSSNSRNGSKKKTIETTPSTKSNDTRKDRKSKDETHRRTSKIGKVARGHAPMPSQGSSSRQKRQKEVSKPIEDDDVGDLRHSTVTPRLRRPAADVRSPNRISYLSMSSDSTKLGEISTRRSRLIWNPDIDDFEYGYRPVYPMHAHKPVAEERAGFFKRLFGGREKS